MLVLEGPRQIGREELQQRGQACRYAGGQGERHGEGEDAAIHGKPGEARNVGGCDDADGVQQAAGEGDSDERATERRDQRFGQQLAGNARAAGPQAGTHGDFAATSGGARQQQAGGIGAADEQHEQHGGE